MKNRGASGGGPAIRAWFGWLLRVNGELFEVFQCHVEDRLN